MAEVDSSNPSGAVVDPNKDTKPAITVTDVLNGAIQGIKSYFNSNIKMPIKNPLAAYASYNYLLGIHCLSDAELNFPDTSYLKNGPSGDTIARSASINQKNRVKGAYGSFEFYIENLDMVTVAGFEKGLNNNVTTFTFDIIEPYSMGTFMSACQYAASNKNHQNWLTAPFLLSITFRGTTEAGLMQTVPATQRWIPFRFNDLKMKVTESGSVYSCEAITWNDLAQDTKFSTMRTNISISGGTVKEILQTGPNSLQTVMNNKMLELQKSGKVTTPDQIVILFPQDRTTASSGGGDGATEESSSAFVPADLQQKLGIKLSTVAGNKSYFAQDAGTFNVIGDSTLRYNDTRKGVPPSAAEKDVYNPVGKKFVRQMQNQPEGKGVKQYGQGQSIFDIITDIVLTSEYAERTLSSDAVKPTGMRNWFRISTQVFNIDTDENMTQTGVKPQLVVYRVMPYEVHVSSAPTSVNTQPYGYNQLSKLVAKQYNYVYTGKNIDIIKFDINFNAGFRTELPADGGNSADGKVTKTNSGGAKSKDEKIDLVPKAKAKPTTPPLVPREGFLGAVKSYFDQGRGANDADAVVAAAKFFQRSISKGYDMMSLDLEILGDPYYIVQSGMGNYSSAPAGDTPNLVSDGTLSMDIESGEVDILVNFRSPTDINQATGLYNNVTAMGGSKTAPVLQFSGLYKVQTVNHKFKSGTFTQSLHLLRRTDQEQGEVVDTTGKQTLTSNTPAVDTKTQTSTPSGYQNEEQQVADGNGSNNPAPSDLSDFYG
jgi:hypothetical protein